METSEKQLQQAAIKTNMAAEPVTNQYKFGSFLCTASLIVGLIAIFLSAIIAVGQQLPTAGAVLFSGLVLVQLSYISLTSINKANNTCELLAYLRSKE